MTDAAPRFAWCVRLGDNLAREHRHRLTAPDRPTWFRDWDAFVDDAGPLGGTGLTELEARIVYEVAETMLGYRTPRPHRRGLWTGATFGMAREATEEWAAWRLRQQVEQVAEPAA